MTGFDQEILRLKADNERLRRGDFSDEEFQALCHLLPETSAAQVFCDGCEAFHRQLFGFSPITKLREERDQLRREVYELSLTGARIGT